MVQRLKETGLAVLLATIPIASSAPIISGSEKASSSQILVQTIAGCQIPKNGIIYAHDNISDIKITYTDCSNSKSQPDRLIADFTITENDGKHYYHLEFTKSSPSGTEFGSNLQDSMTQSIDGSAPIITPGPYITPSWVVFYDQTIFVINAEQSLNN